MMTPGEMVERATRIGTAGHVPVTQADRDEMAVALFFHGYSAGDACHKAFVQLEDRDGALQMLARHRIATAIRRETGVVTK